MKRYLTILGLLAFIPQPVFAQTYGIPDSSGTGTGTGGIYTPPGTGTIPPNNGTGFGTNPGSGTYQTPGIYQNPNTRPLPYPNTGPGSTGGTGVIETPGIRPGSINPVPNNSAAPNTNFGTNDSSTGTQMNNNPVRSSTGGAAGVRGYW